MSGTSLDGIDAAVIRTDGVSHVETGAFITVPYEEGFRARLRGCLGGQGPVAEVERELTELHAGVVNQLKELAGGIDLIGFHGHTILHAPERRKTWQIGDGTLLAKLTGIPVVHDFRTADVAAGGQGAPLVPLYHQALATELERPLAVLNIGGVANVTWLGRRGGKDVLAFDTGPGNALIDDWVLSHTGQPYDADGALAASGTMDRAVLDRLMTAAYFRKAPPKSLDRDAFDVTPVAALGAADGAATLTAFTAAAVARSAGQLPQPPVRWLVTGGGRRNGHLMALLRAMLGVPVEPVDSVGWHGDALEAQAFAYLAVRSRAGLPLSVPGTTGVPSPMTGGQFSEP
ncbi:anhydro-N-acetylmuramic acid kinase [Skermanella stibiiresistens SB22]|uniref:Anhydro-N-acetylmuramic acid kinase n=2 Tax=Skermanella TaxID=204447 RepID=W9GZ22_9PROT|nr:anhydro-N-acetylmuramic acid kinase [Skermanella stibiiresistens SB22]